MESFVSVNDLLTTSGKFLDRAKSDELNALVLRNAEDTTRRFNGLLNDLGWSKPVKYSSGFRPRKVNENTKGSAKRSAHLTCEGGDFEDDNNQTLGKLIMSRPDLLEKWGLMIEDISCTKGENTNWVHLDSKPRPYRPSFSFRV